MLKYLGIYYLKGATCYELQIGALQLHFPLPTFHPTSGLCRAYWVVDDDYGIWKELFHIGGDD